MAIPLMYSSVCADSLYLRSVGLFISLLSQHGDNFKRIAAAMPNKVRFLLWYCVGRELVAY